MEVFVLGVVTITEASVVTPQDPALFEVAGDRTLDCTLHVANGAPLGEGLYRLISYCVQLTDRGLEIGAMPPGQAADSLSIQTATVGQVNLLSGTAAHPLQFWDGSDPTRYGNGQIGRA